MTGNWARILLAGLVFLAATSTAGGKEKMLTASKISIVVAFDNYTHQKDLEVSWGFACVVRGADKTILFDTGGDGAILMGNLKKLKIDPQSIDAVVLSHAHGDHTGGLEAFLAANSRVEVYAPGSFPESFKAGVRAAGAKLVEVSGALEICDGVWSTGELGASIIEESLVLQTDQGLVVITGCAHPGIVLILEKAKQLLGGADVLLAMGGFHLRSESDAELKKIIKRFKELGVRRPGPSHCSGDRTRELFKDLYGDDFVQIGVGYTVRLGEIK